MNKQVKKIHDFVSRLENSYYSKPSTKNPEADLRNIAQALSFKRVRCFIEEMTARELRERLKLFERNEKTCPVYEANRTCKGCSKYLTDGSLCNYIERKVDYLFEKDMVILPCKVGDIVWRIVDASDEATEESRCEKEIKEFLVRSISVSCNSKGIWTKKSELLN